MRTYTYIQVLKLDVPFSNAMSHSCPFGHAYENVSAWGTVSTRASPRRAGPLQTPELLVLDRRLQNLISGAVPSGSAVLFVSTARDPQPEIFDLILW